MFVIMLSFSADRSRAKDFMAEHKAWIERGFAEGVFVLAGGLQANQGGGIIAHNTSPYDLQARVNEDPFIAENIVSAEIVEIMPSQTDDRLRFLAA